ncbi:hypothetical protein B0I35DRAFT_425295 [Stachybotrys elegans]|uniref:C2H2-type domain-containing protein n=1 Tax=Stachybotrys elegans TaxID=80388 RepID=A0A8K0SYU5_9HYPO|nr:hypothetical protein B0I35DRAFT_425295 [Stachybotrys elegans]
MHPSSKIRPHVVNSLPGERKPEARDDQASELEHLSDGIGRGPGFHAPSTVCSQDSGYDSIGDTELPSQHTDGTLLECPKRRCWGEDACQVTIIATSNPRRRESSQASLPTVNEASKDELLLTGLEFDPEAVGRLIYTRAVVFHGKMSPLADLAEDLWNILTQLAANIKSLKQQIHSAALLVSCSELRILLGRGKSLLYKFRDLMRECQCKASMARGNRREIVRAAGFEFIHTLFNRECKLETTEWFMQNARLWNFQVQADVDDLLKPSASSLLTTYSSEDIFTAVGVGHSNPSAHTPVMTLIENSETSTISCDTDRTSEGGLAEILSAGHPLLREMPNLVHAMLKEFRLWWELQSHKEGVRVDSKSRVAILLDKHQGRTAASVSEHSQSTGYSSLFLHDFWSKLNISLAQDSTSENTTENSGSCESQVNGNQQAKRRRGSNGGSTRSSNEELHGDRSKRVNRGEVSQNNEPLLLACPYYKRDQARHQRCLKHVLKRIKDVKQHLSRNHKQMIYCPTCGLTFQRQAESDAHVRSRRCEISDHAVPEGITREQEESLGRRVDRKLSLRDQWYSVWNIIFPGEQPPESPFLQTALQEGLLSFRRFRDERGPAIVSSYVHSFLERPSEELPNEERSLSALLNTVAGEAMNAIIDAYGNTLSAAQDGVMDSANSSDGATLATTSGSSVLSSQIPPNQRTPLDIAGDWAVANSEPAPGPRSFNVEGEHERRLFGPAESPALALSISEHGVIADDTYGTMNDFSMLFDLRD